MKGKSFAFVTSWLILFLAIACEKFDEPVNHNNSKWEVFTTKDGLSSDTIWSLAQDVEGYIWVGAENGICRLGNPSTVKFDLLLPDVKVNSIRITNDLILFATNLGGYALDGKTLNTVNKVIKNCTDIEYIGNKVWCLYEDGEVYSGTNSLGIKRGLNDIYANNGTVWWCTLNGLIQFTNTTTEITTDDGLACDSCLVAYQDNNKMVWVGTFENQGLSRISGNNIKNFNCGYIRTITMDHEGNLWFGSQYHGLYELEANGNLRNYTMLDGLPNNKITDILVIKNGTLWVATEGGGIAKLVK